MDRFDDSKPPVEKAPEGTQCLHCNSARMEIITIDKRGTVDHITHIVTIAHTYECQDCGHTWVDRKQIQDRRKYADELTDSRKTA